MAKRPSYQTIQGNIQNKLRINPKVMQASVPQLTFSPSVGIIARDIDKLGLDIRSFREPLSRAVKQVIIPSIQQNFEQEGRPGWEPYSEATYEIRQKMGGETPSKLLNKTGALQRVMKQFNIWTVNNNAAILLDLPSNVSYGKIHQGGYSSGGAAAAMKKAGPGGSKILGNLEKSRIALKNAKAGGAGAKNFNFSIPARPFVMLQTEDVPAIQRVFEAWLKERVDAHWGKMTR